MSVYDGYYSSSTATFGYVSLFVSSSLITDQNGIFTIPLEVSEKMAPALWLLVYTLHPDKELVADSVRFPVEKCFKNKVRDTETERVLHVAR